MQDPKQSENPRGERDINKRTKVGEEGECVILKGRSD